MLPWSSAADLFNWSRDASNRRSHLDARLAWLGLVVFHCTAALSARLPPGRRTQAPPAGRLLLFLRALPPEMLFCLRLYRTISPVLCSSRSPLCHQLPWPATARRERERPSPRVEIRTGDPAPPRRRCRLSATLRKSYELLTKSRYSTGPSSSCERGTTRGSAFRSTCWAAAETGCQFLELELRSPAESLPCSSSSVAI